MIAITVRYTSYGLWFISAISCRVDNLLVMNSTLEYLLMISFALYESLILIEQAIGKINRAS